jgi:hypothetical protein
MPCSDRPADPSEKNHGRHEKEPVFIGDKFFEPAHIIPPLLVSNDRKSNKTTNVFYALDQFRGLGIKKRVSP